MPTKNTEQDNSDYKKDINFLDQDLAHNVKPSVDFNAEKKSEHKPDLKFQAGSGRRFNLDIDLSNEKKPALSLSSLKKNNSKFHPPEPLAAPKKSINQILDATPQSVESSRSFKQPIQSEPEENINKGLSGTFPSIKELISKDFSDTKEPKITDAVDGFDVNLIPTELRSIEASNGVIKKIVIATIISILFVVIVFASLNFIGTNNKKKIDQLKTEVELYEAEIQKARDTIGKLSSFTDQTKKVSEILQGREIWSSLFDMLETETLPEIYYNSVSVDISDKVVLDVIARSYHDMARQYKIFEQNPRVKNLNINGASLDTSLWQDYITLAQFEAEQTAESNQIVTSSQFSLDPQTLKSLLTVESTISFTYIVNPTSTALDKYEQ